MSEGTTPAPPYVGDVVYDEATHKVGVLMGRVGPHCQLRPVGGGREWDARGPVRPATPAERLSADVARANARSRGEAL